MSEHIELKDCPFCGHGPGCGSRKGDLYWVACLNCWVSTAQTTDELSAANAWNMRAVDAENLITNEEQK